MTYLTRLKDKFERILKKEWPFSEDSKIIEKNPQYFRSLEVLSNPQALLNKELTKVDKLLILFKDIVGMELLIRENKRTDSIWKDFSKRGAWLLGIGNHQRMKIQTHLGTLYSLRGKIVHELDISDSDEDFKNFFQSNLDLAIETANKYHQAVLLRLIQNNKRLIERERLLAKFDELNNEYSIFSLTKSIFQELINDKLVELTKIPPKPEDGIITKLPDKSKCYFLGISTFGGLTEKVHHIIDREQEFHEGDVCSYNRIIPDKDIWLQLSKEINTEIEKIIQQDSVELRIIPKTHLAVLVYFGYHFPFSKNTKLSMDIESSQYKLIEVYLTPLKENETKRWKWTKVIDKTNANDEEIVVIQNIGRSLYENVSSSLKLLKLNKFPKIIFEYRDKKEWENKKCIYSGSQLKHLCLAVEKRLKKKSNLKKIHLFTRGPAAMMILMGMHLRKLKLAVDIYEKGKKIVDDEEYRYYHVLSCNSNITLI